MDFDQNANKYYVMELHESESKLHNYQFRIFVHHGRTDEIESKQNAGTKQTRYLDDLVESNLLYDFIISEKLDDDKGYHLVHLLSISDKLGSRSMNPAPRPTQNKSLQKSKIPESVQSLLQFLFEKANSVIKSVLLAQITPSGIQTPLGVLSLQQIEKGEQILMQIYDLLDTDNQEMITKLSGKFFSLIPHRLGVTRQQIQSSIISDHKIFEEKKNLIQIMKDIIMLPKDNYTTNESIPRTDRTYRALNCRIEQIDRNADKFKKIEHWIINENRKSSPNLTVTVLNIFSLERPEEHKRFTSNIQPQKLLVHGSKNGNFVGLLSRGIYLPDIVLSKGFGKRTDFGFLGCGIYFSDNIYASIKYTEPINPSPEQSKTNVKYAKRGKKSNANDLHINSRFVLLANVALGKIKDYTTITPNLSEPPSGFDSCHGVGREKDNSSQFENDEFVVYRTDQVRLDFLVEFVVHQVLSD
eukprot:TRINITY_DN15714_c0_g1_i1.p1 TRINITY_DN15714_c0_g1~~TRINITY_DN15714_c0_g1_i1.p1  ORF type:complete len:470 (+),score=71.49 TRINITY_DN15714_c0_g1_i1:271-1680(+)